jgi:Leucine-rich repeat (LRR) protein
MFLFAEKFIYKLIKKYPMKKISLFLLFIASLSGYTQQLTTIPDANFRAALLSQNVNFTFDQLNRIETQKLFQIKVLNIASINITDLTGIEDMPNLLTLDCSNNKLISLDVSKNLVLTVVNCLGNKISNLTTNTKLLDLNCSNNLIQALDVSKEVALINFNCSKNQLITLDLSKNIALANFNCSNNLITSLNLKNGNNTNLNKTTSSFLGNANACIQVDNVVYANKNLPTIKESSSYFTTDCANLNYTLIPDSKFETELQQQGYDNSGVPDGKVLKSSINTITSLNVASKSIASLVGIEDFTALTVLYCGANLLTGLDLTKNLNLVALYCAENQITSLDLSANTNLNTVWCYNNKLNNLNLGIISNLQTLLCSNNQLTSLDISKNVGMINLNCSNNKLTNLDISKSNTLQTVNCRYNLLTGLSTIKNSELQTLYTDSNQLTSLNVSRNSKLVVLGCGYNKIVLLDVSKNGTLTELKCNGNLLTQLNLKNGNNGNMFAVNLDFKANPGLSCIQVDNATNSSNNWINEKDPIASYSADCMYITAIPDLNFENELIAQGIDSGAPDGKVLTSKITSIITLDVSSKNIADLTGIQDFEALENLNCGDNLITNLDFSKNLQLKGLWCINNKLTSLVVLENTKLTVLKCAMNQLTSLDVSSNTLLFEFQCSNNLLTSLDVSKNTLIEYFSCSFNKITSLDFSKNRRFSFFSCNDNLLTSLNLRNVRAAAIYSSFKNNPNLNCIEVDDVNYAVTNYSGIKDATATFNTDCNNQVITLIPDINFEKNLISLGYDYGTPDGKVLNSAIKNITDLSLSGIFSQKITSLVGIQDFEALKVFYCANNEIASFNFSKNLNLEVLECYSNSATSIDVSQNTKLYKLRCFGNKFTSLDVSNNPLTSLECSYNPLVSLDLSKNIALQFLICKYNGDSFKSLNLKNGHNIQLSGYVHPIYGASFDLKGNDKLTCIQVDDTTYSDTNWPNVKDATAVYSTDCTLLGVEDLVFATVAVYPNPNNGIVHVDNVVLEKATIYNALGSKVQSNVFENANTNNTIDTSGLSKGIYFLYLQSTGATTAKKIVVE